MNNPGLYSCACLGLRRVLLLVLMIGWGGASLPAQLDGLGAGLGRRPKSHVSPSLIADVSAFEPGKPFRLGVRFAIEEHWHIYWHTPGDAGLPTEVSWRLPEGFSAGPLHWPVPEDFQDSGIRTKGYSREVLIFSLVTPPSDFSGGGAKFFAAVEWLVCKTDGSCIPGDAELELELASGLAAPSEHAGLFETYARDAFPRSDLNPVPATTPGQAAGHADAAAPSPIPDSAKKTDGRLFSFLPPDWNKKKSDSIMLMLLYAFLGGVILNIMPCVLPVLSIKILSFVRQAGQDPRRIFQLGLAFASGVFASFMALALVVVILRAAGGTVGWGFQMQEPRFVIIMSAVVLAFGLSLFGVFEIEFPGSALRNVEGLQHREGPVGAFFNGVLATALATPCTAPLLGPAVGFASTRPSPLVFVFFACIAAGLASPYLLLSARPGWMRFIPKPGNWMNTFKQFMGFLLLATVVWLMSVLGGQVGSDGLVGSLAFLTCVALACWLVGIGFDLQATRGRKWVLSAIALTVVVGGYFYFAENHLRRFALADKSGGASPSQGGRTADSNAIAWLPFSLELVEQSAAEGRTMLLDFTADWCVTCKINEAGALADARVVEAVRDRKVVAIKADWTRKDPLIGEVLRVFGRSGVPLYVVFPGGRPGEPILLPDGFITARDVLDALDEAAR